MAIKQLFDLGSILRSTVWLPILSILMTNNKSFSYNGLRRASLDTDPQLLVPTGVQSTGYHIYHPDRTHTKDRIYH